MTLDMVMVLLVALSLAKSFIEDSLSMTLEKDLVCLQRRMEPCIMANIRMIKNQEKEYV